MKTHVLKLHKEDRKIAIDFIDYTRLYSKTNVTLEILARHLALYLGINPDQPNYKIANSFAKLFESGKIK
jgi:hypothetical protein